MSSSHRPLARGIDAGLNRLAEALRTVEDRLRFDRSLPTFHRRWRELRLRVGRLRHSIEARWGATARWRDVAGDAGAPRQAVSHPSHASEADLLAANVARARESARSVEEALRLALPELAAEAEGIRYAVYELESATIGFASRRRRLQNVRLYVLVTSGLASRPLIACTEAAIAGGAQMIQLREKELPNRELLPLARELRELTRERGVPLIINDRVEIAALSDADGVHQGQDDLPPAEVRKILGPDAIVGMSTHAPEQARAAQQGSADYIGVGPIYETRTKVHRRPVGLGFIAEARAAAPALPAFAIGSINRQTLRSAIEAGARRVAVCTAIIGAEDIEGSARWFRERLDELPATDSDHDEEGD